jgi:GT2 family glycosyltransferase
MGLPVTSWHGTRMRVLAHIHTFNDADVIDRTIDAVRRQTRPVDGILLVDNASSDGTLERQCVKYATVLRNTENQGTSGAINSGFRYAIEHGYDWIWLFDADSIPEPDALQKLLELYDTWPADLQEATAFLACLYYNVEDGVVRPGCSFNRHGVGASEPVPEARYYPCHFTIWSGSLYRLAATRRIGLPNPDYVLDWGEAEYGYRVMKAGYKGVVIQDAVLKHNIRGHLSHTPAHLKVGPLTLFFYEYPPMRCYYSCRNRIYFALYEFGERRFWQILGAMMVMANWMVNFMLRPRRHGAHILACCRGIWHGLTGNVGARY